MKQQKIYKNGKYLGFVLGLIIFSIFLFFILKLSGHLPVNWSLIHIILIATVINMIGFLIKIILNK